MREAGYNSRYTRECEFLSEDLSKLLCVFLLGEAGKLLPHMLQFTDEHREEGEALQEELVAFQEELSKAIEEVWTRPPSDSGPKDATYGVQNATGVGVTPGVGEASKPQDPLDKIVKPQIVEPIWRVTLWDKKKHR